MLRNIQTSVIKLRSNLVNMDTEQGCALKGKLKGAQCSASGLVKSTTPVKTSCDTGGN